MTFSEDVLEIAINVTLINDQLVEGTEQFLARLEILATGIVASLVPDDNALVNILDDGDGKQTLFLFPRASNLIRSQLVPIELAYKAEPILDKYFSSKITPIVLSLGSK